MDRISTAGGAYQIAGHRPASPTLETDRAIAYPGRMLIRAAVAILLPGVA